MKMKLDALTVALLAYAYPTLAAALPPTAQAELEKARATIDLIEVETLAQQNSIIASSDEANKVRILGKALLYDKELSVNRNEACTFCHTPDTGFTGPSSVINLTQVSYPGSTPTRRSGRKPQSYAYAPFSPILHRDAASGELVGGNFWDMRATGIRLANPSSAQAEDPPVDPNEMGFRDAACVVFRLAQRPYRTLFEKVWGEGSLNIAWPSDAEATCDSVWDGNGGACSPSVNRRACLALTPGERTKALRAYDEMAMAIAADEASPDVSPFTAKFDYVQAGKAQFSAEEQRGYALFKGKAKCATCHSASGDHPLFSDWRSANIGIPLNPAVEESPDRGVGQFLRGPKDSVVPLAWQAFAADFVGRFQVPTLRDVDKRPSLEFIKAYGHNGYFKSLKEIVHFYNTRDTLRRCKPHDSGEKRSCWPEAAVVQNMNQMDIGHLGLSDQDENDIVAFLQTLTDGYQP